MSDVLSLLGGLDAYVAHVLHEHGLNLVLIGGEVALHSVDVALRVALQLSARSAAGASDLYIYMYVYIRIYAYKYICISTKT